MDISTLEHVRVSNIQETVNMDYMSLNSLMNVVCMSLSFGNLSKEESPITNVYIFKQDKIKKINKQKHRSNETSHLTIRIIYTMNNTKNLNYHGVSHTSLQDEGISEENELE